MACKKTGAVNEGNTARLLSTDTESISVLQW